MRPRSAAGRALAGVLAAQAVGVAAVLGWVAGGRPLTPGRGLQQLDYLFAHQRVAGLTGTGRPALVVAPGVGPGCGRQVALAARLRGRPGGLPVRYDLVLLTRTALPGTDDHADAPPVRAVPDPGGRISTALGLGDAVLRCRAGYALMTAGGVVRYATYDAGWGHHGSEQTVLLAALARGGTR